MSEEQDLLLEQKLEQIYARVQQQHPKGPLADEAREYYEQAKNFSGEDKLYYMRILASMLEEF